MHTTRTIDWDNIFTPSFRIVHFEEEAAMVIVSTQLRYAWTAIPHNEGLNRFAKENYERSEEERLAVPQNPDTNTVHTRWRDEVYEAWSHVFYDVMNFLQDVGPDVGHYHPPSHDILSLQYPGNDGNQETAAVKKTWGTKVLIIPAHLEPGVAIRVTEMNGKAIGTFDGKNTAEIWYIRAGVEVHIYVEGDYDKSRTGVAAVLVYGILCDRDDLEVQPVQEEDDED